MRESKVVPTLVYYIEQYEVLLLKFSKVTKVQPVGPVDSVNASAPCLQLSVWCFGHVVVPQESGWLHPV